MLFDDNYKTINSKSEGFYKERGSKFISFSIPVTNEAEVKEFLDKIRKEFHDARHVCFAYILGFDKSGIRMNDDGEPSGTGGRPIYGQLLSFDLTNTLIVVVRYFGGSLLGVPGLINAYKMASLLVLQVTPVIQKQIEINYRLQFDYTMMNDIMTIVRQYNCNILSQDMQLFCVMTIGIARNRLEEVLYKLKDTRGIELEKT